MVNSMNRILLSSASLLLCIAGFAQPGFHSSFGDNMVLQQNSITVVKGKGIPDEKITFSCSWDKQKKTVRVSSDSSWTVGVSIPAASFTPHWMQVSSKDGTHRIENILFGEVWLCSGQSNMEMPLRGFPSQPVKGSMEEILYSWKYKNLRLYDVGHKWSDAPLDECSAEWQLPTPENVALFSAVGYVFGSRLSEALGVPVGIVLSSYGGSRIESWMCEGSLSDFAAGDFLAKADKPYRDPYKLYNAMIAPIRDIQIRGVVWLQGESNRRDADVYAPKLKRLIDTWRTDHNDRQLPFIVVQIAPCPYNGPGEFGAARIMEAQFSTVATTEHAYIVGTSDIGGEHFIHFPEKVVLGERICVSALANVYGRKGFPKGNPYVTDIEYEDGRAIVRFANAERGLTPTDQIVECFELAGSDGIYYPAAAKIHKNRRDCVVVSSEQVPAPVNLRFAFSNYHKVNLYSNEGLPAYPFRSDSISY